MQSKGFQPIALKIGIEKRQIRTNEEETMLVVDGRSSGGVVGGVREYHRVEHGF